MKKVSVIIPVYNVEKYIEKCLDSLVNQTLDEIELIFVNDGSPDNSKKIIERYQKKYSNKIMLIDKQNGGQSSARNLGLKKATGEYVAFIDSDDYADKTMLEKMYNLAIKNKYDIVLCGINYVYSDHIEEFHLFNKTRSITSKEYIMSEPAPWNKIYKRTLLNKLDYHFREGIIYEDFALTPTLGMYTNKIGYLDELLCFYVQHPGSTININKYNPKINNIFQACDDLYNAFLFNKSLDKYNKEIEFLFIKHLLISGSFRFMLYKESKDKIKDVVSILKQKFPNWKSNEYFKNSSFKQKCLAYLFYYRLEFIVRFFYRLKRRRNI